MNTYRDPSLDYESLPIDNSNYFNNLDASEIKQNILNILKSKSDIERKKIVLYLFELKFERRLKWIDILQQIQEKFGLN